MSMLNTVAPEKAQGKVKEIYTMFEQRQIPVPLPLQMASVSPDYLAIQGNMIKYFMHHPGLSPSLLAHIRLLVSHEENYTYCINFNTQILKSMIGLSDEQVAAATKDPREAALTPEERSLLLFVKKVLHDPALTHQDDMETLKAQGWTDRDIFDATYVGMNMLAMGMLFKAFKMGE
jgi:alkylhydroperoxidase family enzyme